MNPLVLAAVGGVATFGLLAIALVAVARSTGASERLLAGAGQANRANNPAVAVLDHRLRPDPWPSLSQNLEQTRFWNDLQLLVLRAGLLLRPSEALVIGVATGAVGAIIGWFATREILLSLLVGTFAVGGLYLYLLRLASQRQAKLTSQLPNALDMLASGLRSGHALTRSLLIVASQSRPPMSEEVGHILQDINVGVSTPDALDLFVMRTRSYDIELVVAAIQTQQKLGGNLAEVLDNITNVIRERVKLQREIDAATSEGRLSAVILVAMPFVMAVLVSIISPGYLDPLFQEPVGKMLLVGSLMLMAIGIIVIKNLIEIDF